MYLPIPYGNTSIIEKYGATHIIQLFELLGANLTRHASLGVNGDLIFLPF